jgi:hypothetical protein
VLPALDGLLAVAFPTHEALVLDAVVEVEILALGKFVLLGEMRDVGLAATGAELLAVHSRLRVGEKGRVLVRGLPDPSPDTLGECPDAAPEA